MAPPKTMPAMNGSHGWMAANPMVGTSQHAEQDGRADHQTDEQPLAGTFVFILGQGKCGLGDAHLGFARMR